MKMQQHLHIAADHPSFAGHFPAFPVLPGAVLLDETLRAIEQARGIDLESWQHFVRQISRCGAAGRPPDPGTRGLRARLDTLHDPRRRPQSGRRHAAMQILGRKILPAAIRSPLNGIKYRERGSLWLLRVMAFLSLRLRPPSEPQHSVRHRRVFFFVRARAPGGTRSAICVSRWAGRRRRATASARF